MDDSRFMSAAWPIWALRFYAAGLAIGGVAVTAIGASGHFLPHDERWLGMTAAELCALHGCRIVHFMIHDRVSFGGAILATAAVYFWLIESPLRERQRWAWRTLAISGAIGFASFFSWLSFGYLDTWHAAVTGPLFIAFLLGIAGSARTLHAPVRPAPAATSLQRFGRCTLLATAFGMTVAGLTIGAVGMTSVFVPQDLAFMRLDIADLHALNPRLVPLIAHDRAGFGGAVCCAGSALLLCVWHAEMNRSFWWMLFAVGTVGFGAAILAHPAVGYLDALHLAPAVTGAATYFAGLAIAARSLTNPHRI